MKTPAQFVKEARRKLGLRQWQLAESYGNGARQVYISRWENGKSAVPAEFILWLIEELKKAV